MKISEFLSQFHHFRLTRTEPDFPLKKKGRPAAVLIPLIDYGNSLQLLLTERAHHLKHHPGQIAFPGGKEEEMDSDLLSTALRETHEEVGVHPEKVNTIRELTEVYIPPSNFLATPFIGYVDKKPKFNLNYEVDKTIEVLVSELLNEDNITSVNLTTSYMKNIDVPCFKIGNNIILGATGMMLSEIKELINS